MHHSAVTQPGCGAIHTTDGRPNARGVLRAFIGCRLDDAAHRRVHDVLTSLRERSSRAGIHASYTPFDNLHVTLKFLGMIDDAQLEPLAAVVASVAARHPPLSAEVHGLGTFPPHRTARVVFADIARGREGLISIARDLEAECAALGFERETRDAHPHITLARIKPGPRFERETAFPARSDCGLATIDTLTLFRSAPGPSGPAYTSLAEQPLTGPSD